MLRTQILLVMMLFLCMGLMSAHAAVNITLYDGVKPGNDLVDYPGTTVGWGIDIQNNTANYLQIASSSFSWVDGTNVSADPITGNGYTDIIGGTVVSYTSNSYTYDVAITIIPGGSYTSSYVSGSGGLGSFYINTGLGPAIRELGQIDIGYFLYSGDPRSLQTSDPVLTPSQLEQNGVDLAAISSGYDTSTLNVSVTTIPEPTTYVLLAVSLGVVGLARRKMQKSV